MCVRLVTHSCPTLCNPMDCSPSGSSVHGILQARLLEWIVFSFSRGLPSQPRDGTHISCIAVRFFTIWATREARETQGSVLARMVVYIFRGLNCIPSVCPYSSSRSTNMYAWGEVGVETKSLYYYQCIQQNHRNQLLTLNFLNRIESKEILWDLSPGTYLRIYKNNFER